MERFTKTHHHNNKKVSDTSQTIPSPHTPHNNQNYSTNITLSSAQKYNLIKEQATSGDATTIAIDHNHLHAKTKDIDSVSLASSTHFTMVNGMHPQRNVKEGICSRGHQLTILILSMSFVFLIVIIGMVYMLESELLSIL